MVLVRAGKHKAVRTQVLVTFRMVVLYCSVVHSRVVHVRVGYGRVAIRAACNKIVVFLMNGRLVSKRNCDKPGRLKLQPFWQGDFKITSFLWRTYSRPY